MLQDKTINFGPKLVRVFNTWFESEEASELVEKVWSSMDLGHRPDYGFRNKLKAVKKELQLYYKKHGVKPDEDILELKTEANVLESRAEMGCYRILREKNGWKCALKGEEDSKYFHAYIRRRKSINNIRGLTIDGSWVEEPSELKTAAMEHLKRIFSDQYRNSNQVPVIEDLNFNRLSAEDAMNIEGRISEIEILEAVKGCGNDKAPGTDDNFCFFKKNKNSGRPASLGSKSLA
ncbi:uncharacterized protein [Rutidosis leptorrhynchoides]|uniref:uncharacterized protein n=1 Tax=Rutidosis leptorrhynchoides TaxID=125765 RepID=UPI003A997628